LIELAFVGDVALCGRTPEKLREQLSNTQVPKFISHLRKADLSFANLEVPLCHIPASSNGLRELAQVEDASLLRDLGISVCSLANNHVFDAGAEAVLGTRKVLKELEIAAVGAGANLEEALQPVIIDKKGVKIGFLAFTEGRAYTHDYIARRNRAGAPPLDARLIRRSVKNLRSRVDLLCVSLHYGLNYVHYASPRQRDFAREAALAGADIIIGHHPHVLQGYERIGRCLVFYSLGEFLFDPNLGRVVEPQWEQKRGVTGILKVLWERGQVKEFRMIPFQRDPHFHLVSLEKRQNEEFQKWFAEISSIYEDYDPKTFYEATDCGIAEHAFKVLAYNLKKGNLSYLVGSLVRIRGRHLRIAWTYFFNRMRRRTNTA